MKWLLIAALLTGLAACGADGEPVQPTRDATITISDSGVSGIARLGLRQGPVAISLGLGL
jgi:hypothetical protein